VPNDTHAVERYPSPAGKPDLARSALLAQRDTGDGLTVDDVKKLGKNALVTSEIVIRERHMRSGSWVAMAGD
jgi:hypothetical protein